VILFIFAPLLVAALLCLALNQRVPTRWLGMLGALACLGSVGVLLGTPDWHALALPRQPWVVLADQTIWLELSFNPSNWLFALLVVGGGAAALLSLALALPVALRGFGGLFAALLLTLSASLVGLALQDFTLLPFVWVLVAILSFSALRASGAYTVISMPVGLLAGLVSGLVLLGAALTLPVEPGAAPTGVALAGLLLAVLAVTGAPPFHTAVDETAAAPSGIAGPLIALGLPLLGGVALLRMVGSASLTPAWHTVFSALGALTLIACAVGALGERRLSQLVGWQWSAQIGLVLLALGQASTIATPLLVNAVLTTLASHLAVGVIERQTGTDNLDEFVANQSLLLPGMAFLIAAASAVGVPGTLGFWLRFGLLDSANVTPWAAPVVLAGSTFLAAAYLSPVAAFWRVGTDDVPSQTLGLVVEVVMPVLVALPLLVWGIVPQIANSMVDTSRVALALQIACGGGALALVALPFVSRRAERLRLDREERSTVPAPVALAGSLQLFAWLAAPDAAFRGIWSGLLQGGQWLRRGLALFEQRYYLAGVMIGLVVIILLLL
jgi:formate hydrogenlyase subunit 3/multisubunit Na+/H+ antiporter MnhD subunit